ncbi:hypothetical protein Adi01nite_45340 [Amorphoplanes digitatis]|nr:hypothetical protein GCM10020092_000130 [Actinoplanes digitatis]GID95122.1 hypothetical protein Adi01nite_45340 [Actinoplanes digitatis]
MITFDFTWDENRTVFEPTSQMTGAKSGPGGAAEAAVGIAQIAMMAVPAKKILVFRKLMSLLKSSRRPRVLRSGNLQQLINLRLRLS